MANVFKGSSTYAPGVSTGKKPEEEENGNVFPASTTKGPGAEKTPDKLRGHHVMDMRRQHNQEGKNVFKTHAFLERHLEGGGTLGKVAQRQMNVMGKRIDRIEARRDAKERAKNHSQNPTPQPQQPEEGNYSSSIFTPKNITDQQQNVEQDNDINSTVTGDNNYVSNYQDNSNRFYGGNVTNFNYQSTGEGPDTPATMMTLAGIGNPQDSPADTARFMGKYSDLNADAQKKYMNVGMDVANKYVHRAAQTNPIDTVKLDERISQSIQTHYDNAVKAQSLYQGDVYNFKTPEFAMPKPAAPIESNVEEIADKYKDDLDED